MVPLGILLGIWYAVQLSPQMGCELMQTRQIMNQGNGYPPSMLLL